MSLPQWVVSQKKTSSGLRDDKPHNKLVLGYLEAQTLGPKEKDLKVWASAEEVRESMVLSLNAQPL